VKELAGIAPDLTTAAFSEEFAALTGKKWEITNSNTKLIPAKTQRRNNDWHNNP
jgi:hypothetical protein